MPRYAASQLDDSHKHSHLSRKRVEKGANLQTQRVSLSFSRSLSLSTHALTHAYLSLIVLKQFRFRLPALRRPTSYLAGWSVGGALVALWRPDDNRLMLCYWHLQLCHPCHPCEMRPKPNQLVGVCFFTQSRRHTHTKKKHSYWGLGTHDAVILATAHMGGPTIQSGSVCS